MRSASFSSSRKVAKQLSGFTTACELGYSCTRRPVTEEKEDHCHGRFSSPECIFLDFLPLRRVSRRIPTQEHEVCTCLRFKANPMICKYVHNLFEDVWIPKRLFCTLSCCSVCIRRRSIGTCIGRMGGSPEKGEKSDACHRTLTRGPPSIRVCTACMELCTRLVSLQVRRRRICLFSRHARAGL